MIVARMASQRKIISTNAAPGLCKPKKIIDQNALTRVELCKQWKEQGIELSKDRFVVWAKEKIDSGKWEQVWKKIGNRLIPAYRLRK